MTRQQIREAAIKKGYKIEENDCQIGICKGKGVWYWWNTYKPGDDALCIFYQRYSQNTGIRKMGFEIQWKVELSLRK